MDTIASDMRPCWWFHLIYDTLYYRLFYKRHFLSERAFCNKILSVGRKQTDEQKAAQKLPARKANFKATSAFLQGFVTEHKSPACLFLLQTL